MAIAYSCDECSWNGPDLTSRMRMIDMKYKFVGGSDGCSTAFTGISFWSASAQVGGVSKQSSQTTRQTKHEARCTRLTAQLRTPKHVAQERVVVEPPHAVAPRGLEPVHVLQAPAEAQVAHEHVQDELALDARRGFEEAEEREAQEEEREGRLVPRAVVHAREGAEGREQVWLEEGGCVVQRGWEEGVEERAGFLGRSGSVRGAGGGYGLRDRPALVACPMFGRRGFQSVVE